jgi:Rrf2 family cysteine metabolism transcriptional repressor
MKLSTKIRYGTRAMIDIALHTAQGPTLMKEIAARQDIAPKYLDHILSALRRAGLLKNIRGRGGGYVLALPASQITLKDIAEAVEGPLVPVECLENTAVCAKISSCPTREVWQKLRQAMLDVLEATTLEMLAQTSENSAAQQHTYCI